MVAPVSKVAALKTELAAMTKERDEFKDSFNRLTAANTGRRFLVEQLQKITKEWDERGKQLAMREKVDQTYKVLP